MTAAGRPRSQSPLRHHLHIVSGKGGTGKTTIAAALACALATDGRRVLLCEVEGRHGISELFGVPTLQGAEERRLLRTTGPRGGGEVFGLSIDAEDALLEYLETFYHLGIAGRALDKFGAIDFATSIAPGLRDVLLTGKVYEAVRRGEKKLDTAYDAVVLDAPPTGRIAQFLNVHEAVAGLARVGPIRSQADSIMRVLRSPRAVVHLVTLLEDMPVTETADAITELVPTKITVGTVIANMITPALLSTRDLQTAVAGELTVAVAGLSAKQNALLSAELSEDAERIELQRQCHATLSELGRPLVEIAYDPAGIDVDSLLLVAASLTDQLPDEVDP